MYIATKLDLAIKENKAYDSFPRLISVAERLLIGELRKDLSANKVDITIEQWRILFYLWSEDGINQQELTLRAKKEKSTIARQIDALEKKKLIERRSYGEDKRNKLIFLTKKGKNTEVKAMASAEKIIAKAGDNIEKEELEIFTKVIKQIIKNLD
ncbi:MarR family transcriptional regulator [Leptobacterium flavescens]|uniref:MarR family transcriptional regulator n=1 Tax=Leptobacterium flavescens TaxID=472055 RepID=A0A6P0USX8_9FLAO|nr:MarR family transcriptional regulator [Leptobacterium flavescens]NER13476.1 MarR family transcriptional regulator [Leptobacterium flavescens]